MKQSEEEEKTVASLRPASPPPEKANENLLTIPKVPVRKST